MHFAVVIANLSCLLHNTNQGTLILIFLDNWQSENDGYHTLGMEMTGYLILYFRIPSLTLFSLDLSPISEFREKI